MDRVPAERHAARRHAKKLALEGKLAPALEACLRIIEDQPRDWSTANIVGDLYVRAGERDRAIEQFLKIANALSVEGFLRRAAAFYRKVLNLEPQHERALMGAADIASRRGLLAEARAHLTAAAELCGGRGDAQGAADIGVRLAALNPGKLAGRQAPIPDTDQARSWAPKPDAPIADRLSGEARDGNVRDVEVAENVQSPEGADVDLSRSVRDITVSSTPAFAAELPAPSLEDVFEQFRDEASRRMMSRAAEEHLARGIAFHSAGEFDACVSALQTAALAPHLRFAAASRLGRVYRERGLAQEAIAWFERAAESPPPTHAEGHRLLYDLAGALESVGEAARALAIYVELRTEAGAYLDVPARVRRLTNAQTRE